MKIQSSRFENPSSFLRSSCTKIHHQEGVEGMARDRVRIWYDVEGDYLEVLFDQRPGYFRETANDRVLEKVNTHGNVLGFSVQKVSAIRTQPLDVAL
jgi:uncharacterized protein YuzE